MLFATNSLEYCFLPVSCLFAKVCNVYLIIAHTAIHHFLQELLNAVVVVVNNISKMPCNISYTTFVSRAFHM